MGKQCSSGTVGVAPVKNLPGVTRNLNFYGKGVDGPKLVDMPGYVADRPSNLGRTDRHSNLGRTHRPTGLQIGPGLGLGLGLDLQMA